MDHEEDIGNFEGARGGALVQEARALLQQDEEEAPQEENKEGPKIKMNRIRKKNANRPGGGAAKDGEEKTGAAKAPNKADAYKYADKPPGASGAFTEQDVEFMKKAI